MPVFNITVQDIQGRISPLRGDYEVDLNTALDPNELSELIAIAEDRVLSALPHKYREALTRLDEVLSYSTREGVTSYTLAFQPDTLALYVNYPYLGKAFSLRAQADELPTTQYLLSGSTVSLSALPAGSILYASYTHSQADSFLVVRNWVITLAAIEVANRLWFHRDEAGADRFSLWQEQFDNWTNQLRKGEVGIASIDSLKLVNDPNSPTFTVENPFDAVLRW